MVAHLLTRSVLLLVTAAAAADLQSDLDSIGGSETDLAFRSILEGRADLVRLLATPSLDVLVPTLDAEGAALIASGHLASAICGDEKCRSAAAGKCGGGDALLCRANRSDVLCGCATPIFAPPVQAQPVDGTPEERNVAILISGEARSFASSVVQTSLRQLLVSMREAGREPHLFLVLGVDSTNPRSYGLRIGGRGARRGSWSKSST